MTSPSPAQAAAAPTPPRAPAGVQVASAPCGAVGALLLGVLFTLLACALPALIAV